MYSKNLVALILKQINEKQLFHSRILLSIYSSTFIQREIYKNGCKCIDLTHLVQRAIVSIFIVPYVKKSKYLYCKAKWSMFLTEQKIIEICVLKKLFFFVQVANLIVTISKHLLLLPEILNEGLIHHMRIFLTLYTIVFCHM